MSEELKLSFYANGKQAVDQQMAKELFMAKARCGAQQARIEALTKALEMIAGDRACVDMTMSNAAIARAALQEQT